MKTLLNRIAVALLITALASLTVFPKSKIATVNFQTDITVNGTLVKQGVYNLKFDDKSGELTVMKGSKVIARSTTSATKRDRKTARLEIRTSRSGDDVQLTSVAFGGSDKNLVLNGSAASR